MASNDKILFGKPLTLLYEFKSDDLDPWGSAVLTATTTDNPLNYSFLLFASGTTIFGYGPILSSQFSCYCNTELIGIDIDSGELIGGIAPTRRLSCSLSSTSITNLSVTGYIITNTGVRATTAKYQYDIYGLR